MKRRSIPDRKILHECFEYTPESKTFLRWKKRPLKHFPTSRGCNIFNATCSGKDAGSPNPSLGYYCVAINKRLLYVHRIVFAMFNDLPDGYEVDHIDGNNQNNSITNLRLATRTQNTSNRAKISKNISGIKGVTQCSGGTRWQARIGHRGESFYLGCFSTKEEAAAVYEKAARKLFKEFNRK